MTLVPPELAEFLGARTPADWVEAASHPASIPILLLDHANCEKKAASTALALMFRYEQHEQLSQRLSRLAREELRHFEQVCRLMRRRAVTWRHVSAARYAAGLATMLRGAEPHRLVDRLLVGAFIEARSCERFALLVPRIDDELAHFYQALLAAEARHFQHYLELAKGFAGDELQARIGEIREVENRLATTSDTELRFHSGPPAMGAASGAGTL